MCAACVPKSCAHRLPPFAPRQVEPEEPREEVDGQREAVHLSIEGDDEGLEHSRTRPFLPALRRQVAVHQPRSDDDDNGREAPHSEMHQTASLSIDRVDDPATASMIRRRRASATAATAQAAASSTTVRFVLRSPRTSPRSIATRGRDLGPHRAHPRTHHPRILERPGGTHHSGEPPGMESNSPRDWYLGEQNVAPAPAENGAGDGHPAHGLLRVRSMECSRECSRNRAASDGA